MSKELTTTTEIFPDVLTHPGRPAHEHYDLAGHRWKCDSPYCEYMLTDHPNNGGIAPIQQGREPWRGR